MERLLRETRGSKLTFAVQYRTKQQLLKKKSDIRASIRSSVFFIGLPFNDFRIIVFQVRNQEQYDYSREQQRHTRDR